MSDIWDDAASDLDMESLTQRRIIDNAVKIGFRDAVEKAEPPAIQFGFEYGYQDAKPLAREIGRLYATIAYIRSIYALEQRNSGKMELDALEERVNQLKEMCKDAVLPVIHDQDVLPCDYDRPPQTSIYQTVPPAIHSEFNHLDQQLQSILQALQ